MSSRPEPRHRPTEKTLATEEEVGGEAISDPQAKDTPTGGGAISDPEVPTPTLPNNTIYDAILLVALLIMLVWPWIFFGVVWGRKGLQMGNRAAKVVTDHPHATSFFVTYLANFVNLIVSILFSFAIIRLAQERVVGEKDITVFDVSLLSALRHQSWPWGIKDLSYLFDRTRWLAAALVGGCIAAFTFVPGSTTSLISPAPYNRTERLTGTELNVASTGADCLTFLNTRNISNNCDWGTFNGLNYTNCLAENQLVDILESGRGNILSLISNNSEALALSQLGGRNGLRFLGPIRGVLPIGPNGVPAFNTLQPSVFEKNPAGMISYNYTLDHQGYDSSITCRYDTVSPIRFSAVTNNTLMVSYNATCADDGLADVLTNVNQFTTPNTNNTLTFWSCKSVQTGNGPDPTYYIYLRGRLFYETAIGNITCALSPIRPATFSVTYQSSSGIFKTQAPSATFTNTFPTLLERALVSLGGVIQEAQNIQSNLVAESVITFGVKAFRLPPYQPNEQFLRLYEAMLQGIIEYETTYARLIYSTILNPPDSCVRQVTGAVNYMVMGWSVDYESIGLLIPMTIVNLASLIVLIIAMINAKGGSRAFDPLKPGVLLLMTAVHNDEEDPDEEEKEAPRQPIVWEQTVKYRTGLLRKETGKFGNEQTEVAKGAAKSAIEDVLFGNSS